MTDIRHDINTTESQSIGQFLQDTLEAKNMTQSELCEMTSIAKSVFNDVIKGRRSLTAEMAVLIESALGVSADSLMQMQVSCELEKAYNDKRVMSLVQKMSDWETIRKSVSIPTLKKLNLLKSNTAENVDAVLGLCHVSNVDEFSRKTRQEKSQAYYKKSDKLTVDNATLFTWKCYCIDEALKTLIDTRFNKDSVSLLKNELVAIFTENKNTYNRIQDAFYNYGIRMLYINKVGQVPVDGMSFWLDDNPTVIITKRLPNIDNLAFSVMHELGHVIMHLEPNDNTYINLDGESFDEYEEEANAFAREAFFPQKEWDEFMHRIKNCNPFAVHAPIKREADKLGINPQILYGRYMHDTGLYRLRRVFETEVK